MSICDNLEHPFKTDSGTSQRQRIAEGLLSGAPQIDGRKMADLLDHFVQLSKHIKYYDNALNMSDWQPFFKKSVPFVMASLIKYDLAAFDRKFERYDKLFNKHPSKQSIQLLQHFIFYHSVKRINTWYLQLKDSGLPVASVLAQLIKDKLGEPVKKFILLSNTAVQKCGVKKIDFSLLLSNGVWGLNAQDLAMADETFRARGRTKRTRLISLQGDIKQLWPSFLHVIRIAGTTAEGDMEQSLFPLKEEFQQLHTPHLGLLFSFLKLFTHLQSDLNSFTRKHLDYFYREVLKLKPGDATGDKAHIIFEIQNKLDKHLLTKGLQVKDGKDSNKAEIIFALEDEIVVNKAEVADVRTLFLNHHTAYDTNYIEGVYAAGNALKADGVKIDFKDGGPKNWPTVGAKYSKYIDPEQQVIKPYPNARIGFILASPVLLLNEGKRTIETSIACELKNICVVSSDSSLNGKTGCCSDTQDKEREKRDIDCVEKETAALDSSKLFELVNKMLAKSFILVTESKIIEAVKKGLNADTANKIRRSFLLNTCSEHHCCATVETYNNEAVIPSKHWYRFLTLSVTASERILLTEWFPVQRVFNIYFSGAKQWLQPDAVKYIRMEKSSLDPNRFFLNIKTVVKDGSPAITFYDNEKLKEDLNTTQPLLKVELNQEIKVVVNKYLRKKTWKQERIDARKTSCCLQTDPDFCAGYLSLYSFFRDVIISETDKEKTKITVRVCGVKNFVVQNEESLQNVNGPVYPFGTRPTVKDFDIVKFPSPAHGVPYDGPDFYIGSKEIFCKKWTNASININWKDKPGNFFEYYQGYIVDKTQTPHKFGLDQNKFLIKIASLEQGQWNEENFFRQLFHDDPLLPVSPSTDRCAQNDSNNKRLYEQRINLTANNFNFPEKKFSLQETIGTEKFDVDSRTGFIRISLRDQDFLHKSYSYVLARQMMALGKLPDDRIEDAIYYDATTGNLIVFNTNTIKNDVIAASGIATRVEGDINATSGIKNLAGNVGDGNIVSSTADDIRIIILPTALVPIPFTGKDLTGDVTRLKDKINDIMTTISNNKKFQAIIPNEPWTPIIKNISLDYTATADIKDIDLIHLYPYDGTYKPEEIELQPSLFPTFCDEGNLFIGLQKLVPGSNVNMLFQLAEATADAESEREAVNWYYLQNNTWKNLRPGFEVLNDDTNGLTTSGIIKFALPANMTNENSILPTGLHWIKAAIGKNSRTISETIGIHTQAIKVLFTNDVLNDKMRLSEPLPAQSVAKLKDADTAVKKVNQPYDSFGGRIPEIEGQFYIRVSELLRHKGRAVQKFDYERLALQEFPELFKAKCINHSYGLNAHRFNNDFPIAPGYVLLAVIPDLNKLKAGQSFEPRVPVSILEKITAWLCRRTSAFVRLKVINPRYEKVNFCLKVKLYLGKDEVYYKEKLQQDIRNFLAPWAIGEYHKLTFGQSIHRSDIVGFLETRDYIDYLLELRMAHEFSAGAPSATEPEIWPETARSILIAGEIDVCIPQNSCDDWDINNSCANMPQKLVDYCNANEDSVIT